MRMDAHLHSILAYAGIDPVDFVRDLATKTGYTLATGLDVAATVNAMLPAPVFNHVALTVFGGTVTLFLATGTDEGGHIEVVRIGSKMHVQFTLAEDDEGVPYDLLKGGIRDLRKDREVGTLREPRHGKPAWIVGGFGQVQIHRRAIDALMPESFVDIPVEIDVDIDDGAPIEA